MKANGRIRVYSRAFLASTLEAAQHKLHIKYPRRPVDSVDGTYGPSGHSAKKILLWWDSNLDCLVASLWPDHYTN